jgi:hypothetical protein
LPSAAAHHAARVLRLREGGQRSTEKENIESGSHAVGAR